MIVHVCLVCLNATDSSLLQENCEGVPLLTKFLKLVENYLQVSTGAVQQFLGTNDGDSFCEKCELAVINPICQVYLQLVSNQLRLSWELGQLGKHLKASQSSSSGKLKLTLVNMEILTNQLGMENIAQVEEFRSLLTEKCK